jgi:hypothetical protein
MNDEGPSLSRPHFFGPCDVMQANHNSIPYENAHANQVVFHYDVDYQYLRQLLREQEEVYRT